MTDLELAYLAGFFDGEGCVSINKPDRKGRMSLPAQGDANEQAGVATVRDRVRRTDHRQGQRSEPQVVFCLAGLLAGGSCGTEGDAALLDGRLFSALVPHFQPWNSIPTMAASRLTRVIHPRRDEIIAARTTCYNQLRVLNKRGVSA